MTLRTGFLSQGKFSRPGGLVPSIATTRDFGEESELPIRSTIRPLFPPFPLLAMPSRVDIPVNSRIVIGF